MTTVVVEGDAGGSRWRLEAWRAAQGERRVFCGVRWRDRGDGVPQWLSRGELAVDAPFSQDAHSDASVLYGPVADGVEAVVVEPLVPLRRAAQEASSVSADGLGHFFVIAFDDAVELAGLRVEPEGLSVQAFAINTRLERRRQSAEGVEIGRGATPRGKRWRLRLWRDRPDLPEQLRVDLTTAADDWEIDRRYSEGWAGSAYGGPPMPTERVISCRMSGSGTDRENNMVGEVVPAVGGVIVRLDDGSGLEAQIVRTDIVKNDYFMAFYPRARHVVEVAALDGQDRLLAHHDVDHGRLGQDPPPEP